VGNKAAAEGAHLVNELGEPNGGLARTGGSACPACYAPIFQCGMPAVFRHTLWEQIMTINKDQVEGRIKEAEGKIKEAAGKLVGNESLEAKGKVQKHVGHAQAKFGDVKQDLKDAVKDAAK
jgi:uncharacterized protein YjbJ (UPF0337 family)